MLRNCDCGACCEQCGHENNCIRNEKNEEPVEKNEARIKSGLVLVAEIAEELRVSAATVHRLIHAGELPALRAGRAFRVTEADFTAYKKRRAGEEE